MKFCTDCKHVVDGLYRSHHCDRKATRTQPDVVDGRTFRTGLVRCDTARASWLPWNCGAKARFFIPIKATQ